MLAAIAFLACTFLAKTYAQNQSVVVLGNYIVYTGYSCLDFESATSSFAPTLDHCIKLADSTASNGAMYAASTAACIVLTTLNNEITVRVRPKSGWTTMVKDISNSYRLVLKSDSGQGGGSTAYRLDYIITKGSGVSYTSAWNSSIQSFTRSTSCGCTYRSTFFDAWIAKNVSVSKVRIRMWSGTFVAMDVVFNGTNATESSWFDIGRAISSKTFTLARFIAGIKAYEALYLARNAGNGNGLWTPTDGGSCGSDRGFFASVLSSMCSYSNSAKYPVYLYSLLATDTYYSTTGSIGFADFFTIEVAASNRVMVLK